MGETKKSRTKKVQSGRPVQASPMKKENGWIRFLRVIIYAVSIMGTTVGASLIKTGGLSASYADGTYITKIQNGEVIFFASLIVLCVNVMWGVLRWFLRGYRERWRAGRIIGKLIGGGIWRTLVIVPLVLVSLFLITPAISNTISENVLSKDIKREVVIPSGPLDRLEYIAEHLEDFTLDELEEELEPYLFNNVRFDTDASGNVATAKAPGIFTQNVSAHSRSVTTLNKVVLSPSEKFVVFYTDTGDNAITDAKAHELADMLDDIIERYESLGFEYENDVIKTNNATSLFAAKMLLKSSGIGENILSTAMPVYIMNPFKNGNNTLAFYTGRKNAELLGRIAIGIASVCVFDIDLCGGTTNDFVVGPTGISESAWMTNSTPVYPFFTILPDYVDSDNLSIISAHELGHHFEAIYGYANNYGQWTPEKFVNETIANWMAINVFPERQKDDLINSDHYNLAYLGYHTSTTISDAWDGYAAVAFLENYANIVPGAKTIIMDADFSEDALGYLYNYAGEGNYRKVMTTLAEKNLTGDYGGKLINYTLPKGEQNPCTDFCTEKFEIEPSATEYLYFATDEYKNTLLEFLGNTGETNVSILGKNINREWEILESGSVTAEFEITEDTAQKYEVVAFAVADCTINDVDEYIIKITKSEMAEIVADEGEYDFSEFYEGLGDGCIEIDTNALFDDLTQIVNLSSELVGALSELGATIDPTADFSEVQSEYNSSAYGAKSALAEAKADLAPYRITICGNYIANGYSFDAVKSKLQSVMGGNINIIDEKDGSDRLSVFVGFNLLTRDGKVYILAQSSDEMGLITANVSEK